MPIHGLLAWPTPEGLAGTLMRDTAPCQFGPRLWRTLQAYRDDLPAFLTDVQAYPPLPEEGPLEWLYVVYSQRRLLGVWRQTATEIRVLANYPIDGTEPDWPALEQL